MGFSSALSAQTTTIDTTHRCIYTTRYFTEDLYIFGNDPEVEEMVNHICEIAGVERDFSLLKCNVPGVAAVIDGENRYLLFSRTYLKGIGDKYYQYAILAHEIGHLVRNHSFDESFRHREEAAADEFAGRVMLHLLGFDNIGFVDALLEEIPYAYEDAINRDERRKELLDGWKAADALLRSDNNLGYLENETNLGNLTIPQFRFSGCPKTYEIPLPNIRKFATLKDVNELLSKALEKQGFDQQSYYYVENGFALAVPMEQIRESGVCLTGKARWQDYPSRQRFDGVLDYLSSIVYPNPGYFRLFVFMVTKDNPQGTGGKMNAQETRDWLKTGGFLLPKSVGDEAFTADHHVMALVYEFEAPESDKLLRERCNPRLLAPKEHLQKSGILTAINRN